MSCKKGWVFAFLGTLVIFLFSGCVNYSKEIKKALKRAYGQDMRGYTFRGTPVGNFGAGTMYLDEIENPNTPIEERWLVGHPDTWFAETVTQDEKDFLMNKIIIKGTMGNASIREDISRKLGLEASIPVLQNLLDLGANVSLEKGVKVTLKASEAVNRRINWTEFQSAVDQGKISEGVTDHVYNGDYLIAAADVVLSGYKATITVDEELNSELNAKLTEAVKSGVLGTDAQMKIKFDSSHSGTFEVEAANPVVAAILFKRPPKIPRATAGVRELSDMDQWPTVRIKKRTLKTLEERLSRKRDIN